ncbi:MAG: hypothetical protein J5879_07165 [Clostridia bacterium]|nr:hypothetical protein [Clostridia bacterium]
MKRKEILYDAVSGISEDKAADAYEYSRAGKRSTVLQSILKGAGIAAIFCAFVVLSLVLLKLSGPKGEPGANAASSGSELITETETETEKETEVVTETAAVTGKINTSVNVDVDHPSIEELYQMEPYKNFMPEKIPEYLVYPISIRWLPGTYYNEEGTYSRWINEREILSICDSRSKDGQPYKEMQIYVSYTGNKDQTESLSVYDFESGVFTESHYDGPEIQGSTYAWTYRAGDGWEVTYRFKFWPVSERELSAQEMFDIVTSSQFFKDHPEILTGAAK